MQRQIPIRGTTVAGVFDQRIFGRQRVADRGTRQIGHLQMNRGDPRQTLIVGVWRRSHSCQAERELVDRRLAVIGAFQQALDFAALADDEASVTSLDQRRVAEPQAIVGAGKPEIPRPGLG
jgi:hypothetical protein